MNAKQEKTIATKRIHFAKTLLGRFYACARLALNRLAMDVEVSMILILRISNVWYLEIYKIFVL